jgi:hypothetical protein
MSKPFVSKNLRYYQNNSATSAKRKILIYSNPTAANKYLQATLKM